MTLCQLTLSNPTYPLQFGNTYNTSARESYTTNPTYRIILASPSWLAVYTNTAGIRLVNYSTGHQFSAQIILSGFFYFDWGL